MRRNWVGVGLIALVLCFSVAFLTGCAKKATLKEGGRGHPGAESGCPDVGGGGG